MNDLVSVILCPRDLFSSIEPSLANLLAHTPEDVPVLAVIGGAPAALRERWIRKFAGRVQLHFEDHFLSPPEARNIGLRRVETPLAAIVEADVFVRQGWLEALLDCQRETAATMVTPLVLERPRIIHCAGCDLYVTYEGGTAYGHKELRYWRMPYAEGANLERTRTDYGELHCQLVEVEPALRLGVYDEKIMEVGEVDSGLTWKNAGLDMWVEPKSVVHFVEDAPIRAEDIAFYAWRWDMHTILEGYRYFEQKWKLDISEHGDFRLWLYRRNNHLGLLPRWFPSETSLRLSRGAWRLGWKLRRLLQLPGDALDGLRKRRLGFYAWPELEASRENHRQNSHPDLERQTL